MALDPLYARKLGVDIDNLLISQPDYGEQALEITEALVRSGAIDVLVVDSVAAPGPEGRTRWRDGRFAYGTAGAVDVAGAAQADGDGFEVADEPDLSSTRSARRLA